MKIRDKECEADRTHEERGLEGNWNGQGKKKYWMQALQTRRKWGPGRARRGPKTDQPRSVHGGRVYKTSEQWHIWPWALIWGVISTLVEGLINQRILGHQQRMEWWVIWSELSSHPDICLHCSPLGMPRPFLIMSSDRQPGPSASGSSSKARWFPGDLYQSTPVLLQETIRKDITTLSDKTS